MQPLRLLFYSSLLLSTSPAGGEVETAEGRLAQELGLNRRADAKFEEIVDSRHPGDGYAKRRG